MLIQLIFSGKALSTVGFRTKNQGVQFCPAQPGSEFARVESFHSYAFYNSYMVAWKYYGIGPGIKIPYVGAQFKPTATLLKKYESCTTAAPSQPIKPTKERMGRKLNTLFFCPEPNCAQHFSTKDELDQHLLGDAHSVIQLSSSMDHVKQRYINQLNNNIYKKQELSNSAMVSRAS